MKTDIDKQPQDQRHVVAPLCCALRAWPFCVCVHHDNASNNGRLSQRQRGAAAAIPTVFAGPLSLLHPIPKGEE